MLAVLASGFIVIRIRRRFFRRSGRDRRQCSLRLPQTVWRDESVWLVGLQS